MKYFIKSISVSCFLILFGATEIYANSSSIGYIGPTSSSSPNISVKTSTKSSTANSSTGKPSHDPTAVNPKSFTANDTITSTSISGFSLNVQAPSVQVQPFTGSANLSFPIQVPAGRGGIQPNLTLAYNSSMKQLGNAGVGWNLDLGSIQISTINGIPKYNGSDIFTIEQGGSTQNLVPDPAISGLYHREVESDFAMIQYFTTYWMITDKHGVKYYFGNTGDSQQSDPNNPTHIFRWALNKVEDLNGNYMLISYLDNQGQIYPQTITYTGNDKLGLSPYSQVSINYGLISQAQIATWYNYNSLIAGKASYLSGFMINTIQRINSINVSVGKNLQYKYNLSYSTSFDTQRDILSSIVQTGADGTSNPPVTLTYQSNNGLPSPTYSLSTSFGNVGYVSSSSTLPQILGDFNGDGKTDVAVYNPNTKQMDVYLSNGASFGSAQVWFSNLSISSTQTILTGDFNGDGRSDILIYDSSNGNWRVLLSNGSVFADSGLWASSFGVTGPWTTPDGLQWSYSQIIPGVADFNGDGVSDIYYKKIGCANGCGEGIVYGALNINQKFQPFTNTLGGGGADDTIFIGDVNGDGLADMLVTGSGVWFGLTNQGIVNNSLSLATMSYDDVYTYNFTPYAGTTINPIVADFTNDGSTTQIGFYNQSSNYIAYTPLYSGLYPPNTANAPQVLAQTFSSQVTSTGPYQAETADFRGNGVGDLVVFDSKHNATVYLSNENRPDLLIGLNNGIGATMSIVYDSALHYSNTYLPYYIPVVKSTTTTVGAQKYTTNYSYSGGLRDTTYREFDGFNTVTVTDPDGNFVKTTFLQDHWLRGHSTEVDTYEVNGNLFTKVANQWQAQNLFTNNTTNQISKFDFLSRADNYLYDGNSTATPKRTAQEFTYGENPQYGDVTQIINDGQVDSATGASIDSNKTTINVSYVNNKNIQLLGLPSQAIAQDVNGNIISKTLFYYDGDTTGTAIPSLGRLTAKVNWLGSSTQADPKTTYAYDAYGNLQTTTDPNGNTTTITYDNTVHMLPVQTTNALNQSVLMTYYGIDSTPLNNTQGLQGLWGQQASTSDANHQTAYTTYDTLGRTLSSIAPLDSVALPTEQKSYNIQPSYIAVTDTAREVNGSSATLSTVSYYDGLGRLIETKSLGPTVGQYIASGQTVYDNRGLPITKYLSHFTTNDLNTLDTIDTTVPSSQATYDPMGRVVTKTNPDGTYSSVTYNQWSTTTTDENGHMQQSIVDAFGRLVQKQEYLGADGRSSNYPASTFTIYATTSYNYDPQGNLTSVMDAQNNVTTISYDHLGRKIGMNDPDMGKWQYGYDNNGNLIWQQDAKGQVISFKYDALNRLTNKTDAITGPIVNLPNLTPQAATFNVNYNFDDTTQSFGIGRLGSVNYDNGTAGFIYDQLGREASSNKTIGGLNYNVTRQYDALNRLQQLQYPDGSQVSYVYNQAGQVSGIADTAAVFNGTISGIALNKQTSNDRLAWFDKAMGVTNAFATTPNPNTVIYLKSGSTWTVPADWNNASNSIEVIGGGGAGGSEAAGGVGAGGGGGGAYSKLTNASFTAGTVVGVNIGTTGAVNFGASGGKGGDTYLCNSTSSCTSLAATGVIVGAQGGFGGIASTHGNNAGGLGGSKLSGKGTITNSGGAAGKSDANGYAGGGGGGAAGLNGDGSAGGSSSASVCTATSGAGGAGDNGLGGASAIGVINANGTTGKVGAEYGSNGSGGAGAGAGGYCGSNNPYTGGNGGAYGAGSGAGGGESGSGSSSHAGIPGSGIIVITYTPIILNAAPIITNQSASQTVTAPATATFAVAATGTPAPTYQWMQEAPGATSFNVINGANNASYTTAATSAANNGTKYECVVTNLVNSVTSNPVTLTVNTVSNSNTVIYLKSGSRWTVPADWNNASNSIEVIGGGGAGGSETAGGVGAGGGGGGAYSKLTNATLTTGATIGINIGAAGAVNFGASGGKGGDSYLCNSSSSCTSLTDTGVIVGAQGGFGGIASVHGNNAGGLGGSKLSGKGTIKNSGGSAGKSDANGYTGGGGGGAAGLNGDGSIGGNSSAAVCTATSGAGGSGDNGFGGASAIGVINANGTSGKAGAEYGSNGSGGAGAGAGGYCGSNNPYTGGNGGAYGAGSGAGGGESGSGSSSHAGIPGSGIIVITYTPIVLNVAPSITTQPVNQTVTAPGTATFNVIATGTPVPTYQWMQEALGATTFTPISGATGASYTTPATTIANNATSYECVVTNSAGSVTSNPATLTVSVPVNVYVKAINYNANGQITQIQYGNGTVTAYTYDPLSFRLMRIYTTNAQALLVQDLNYTYDSSGQVLSIKDNVNTATQSFTYDALNRLLTAQNGIYGSKTYAYDTIGNITLKDGLTYNYGELNSRTDGSKAGPHAVTSLSDGSIFKYDLNGNMVTLQKGTNLTQYAYDSQNRLQHVTVGGLKVADYTYDGDGGRTEKTVYRRDLALYNDNTNTLLFGSVTNPLPATAQNPTVDNTIDVGNVYEIENPSSVNGSQSRITKFVYMGSTRVASVDNARNLFFYHSDHLGGTNVLTDQAGLVRELTEYDPYGKVVIHDKYGNNFAIAWYYFTGKLLDDETGLTFFGARYYNPSLGRFITSDDNVPSMYSSQAFNRYSYCYNNPVLYVDPNGHWPIGFVVGAVVGGAQGFTTGLYRGGIWQGLVGGAVGGGIGALAGWYLPDNPVGWGLAGGTGSTAANFVTNLLRREPLQVAFFDDLPFQAGSGVLFGITDGGMAVGLTPTVGKIAAQGWSQVITTPALVSLDLIDYALEPRSSTALKPNPTIPITTCSSSTPPSTAQSISRSSGGGVSSGSYSSPGTRVIFNYNGGWGTGSSFGFDGGFSASFPSGHGGSSSSGYYSGGSSGYSFDSGGLSSSGASSGSSYGGYGGSGYGNGVYFVGGASGSSGGDGTQGGGSYSSGHSGFGPGEYGCGNGSCEGNPPGSVTVCNEYGCS